MAGKILGVEATARKKAAEAEAARVNSAGAGMQGEEDVQQQQDAPETTENFSQAGRIALDAANAQRNPSAGGKTIEQQAIDMQQGIWNESAADRASMREAQTMGAIAEAAKTMPVRGRAGAFARKMIKARNKPGSQPAGSPTGSAVSPSLTASRFGADGKLAVATPNLDAGKFRTMAGSTKAAEDGQIAMQNRNATQLAANPAVQAAKNRVAQEDLARKGQQIAGRVNGANPQMRANSLAGMPGVNSVSIREGDTRYVGGGGTVKATAPIASAPAPVFKAPAVPAAIPAAPKVATSVPSFQPPAVGPVAVQPTQPAAPTAAPNPGADFMDSRIAAATKPINPQAAPKLGVPSVATAPTSQIKGYNPKLPATAWPNIEATRKHTAAASGNPQTDDNGLGQVASDVSGALHTSNQFVRDQVVNKPIAAIKQVGTTVGKIATDPAYAKTWAEGIAKVQQPAAPAMKVARGSSPAQIFSPRPVGSTPRALTPRPSIVRQSAVTQPRNKLFPRS